VSALRPPGRVAPRPGAAMLRVLVSRPVPPLRPHELPTRSCRYPGRPPEGTAAPARPDSHRQVAGAPLRLGSARGSGGVGLPRPRRSRTPDALDVGGVPEAAAGPGAE